MPATANFRPASQGAPVQVGRRYRSPRTIRYSVSDCFPERVRLGEAVSGEGFSGTQCHLAQRWEIISG